VQIKDGKCKIAVTASETIPGKDEKAIDPRRDFSKVESFDIASKEWKIASTARLVKILEKAGLYNDEARGMADVWEKEFFKTEGLRIIYRIEQKQISKLFPLYLSETPKTLKRVMLIMVEN